MSALNEDDFSLDMPLFFFFKYMTLGTSYLCSFLPSLMVQSGDGKNSQLVGTMFARDVLIADCRPTRMANV